MDRTRDLQICNLPLYHLANPSFFEIFFLGFITVTQKVVSRDSSDRIRIIATKFLCSSGKDHHALIVFTSFPPLGSRALVVFLVSLFFFTSFYLYITLLCMSLIYGLVARGSTILAEHTNSSGNFATGNNFSYDHSVSYFAILTWLFLVVTQAILEKIPPNNSKLTYVYDRYYLQL